jgi:hypothetical protein
LDSIISEKLVGSAQLKYLESDIAKSYGAGLYLLLPSWDFDEA